MRQGVGAVLMSFMLVACGSILPAEEIPTVELQGEAPSASATPILLPIETASSAPPTPAANPALTLSPTPLAVRIEPIDTAAVMEFGAWSRQSDWFAYWRSEQPPTGQEIVYTLVLYNAETAESCRYPDFPVEQIWGSVTWEPDGKVTITSAGQAMSTFPCQEFTSVPAQITPEDCSTALSPGERYRVATEYVTVPDEHGAARVVTSLTDTESGIQVNRLEWSSLGGLGSLCTGGEWISGETFLIIDTADRGPLLLHTTGEVMEVGPELFGVPGVPEAQSDLALHLQARGASIEGTDYTHIILAGGKGIEAEFPPVLLYHSETGEVETLAGFTRYWGPFTADGRYLLLLNSTEETGYEIPHIWIRPVDPPGSAITHLIGGSYTVSWNPDSTLVAGPLSSDRPRGIQLVTFPEGELVAAWETANYSVFPAAWSPDGRWLVALGNIPNDYHTAMYIIDVEAQP